MAGVIQEEEFDMFWGNYPDVVWIQRTNTTGLWPVSEPGTSRITLRCFVSKPAYRRCLEF
jgi:hypothetical protein